MALGFTWRTRLAGASAVTAFTYTSAGQPIGDDRLHTFERAVTTAIARNGRLAAREITLHPLAPAHADPRAQIAARTIGAAAGAVRSGYIDAQTFAEMVLMDTTEVGPGAAFRLFLKRADINMDMDGWLTDGIQRHHLATSPPRALITWAVRATRQSRLRALPPADFTELKLKIV